MLSTRYQFKVAIIRYENVIISSSKCRIPRQAFITQDVNLVEVLKLWLMLIPRHGNVDNNLTAPLRLTHLRGLQGQVRSGHHLSEELTCTVTEMSLSLITDSPMDASALTNSTLFFR